MGYGQWPVGRLVLEVFGIWEMEKWRRTGASASLRRLGERGRTVYGLRRLERTSSRTVCISMFRGFAACVRVPVRASRRAGQVHNKVRSGRVGRWALGAG